MSEINRHYDPALVQEQIILTVSTGLSTKKGFQLICSLCDNSIVGISLTPNNSYIKKNFGIEITSKLTTSSQNTEHWVQHKFFNQVISSFGYHSQYNKINYFWQTSDEIKKLLFKSKMKQHQLIPGMVKDNPEIIFTVIKQLLSDYSVGIIGLEAFIHEYFKLLETSFFHKEYIRSPWVNESIHQLLFDEDKPPLAGYKKLLYKIGIYSYV